MTRNNGTCFELIRLVRKDVKFPLENRRKLTTIFNAWVDKHSRALKACELELVTDTKCEGERKAFKTMVYRQFLDESRRHDNHMWLWRQMR